MLQTGPVSVLVAPLDWGLGHATRCIPIINELTRQGARVIIASSGSQKQLLRQEFPDLECLEIPGYNLRYKSGIFLKWGLILKIPALLRQIKRENRWLDETVQNYKIDGLISDNRYGLYHKSLFCVFLTHQLSIQSGLGSAAKNYPVNEDLRPVAGQNRNLADKTKKWPRRRESLDVGSTNKF